MNNSNKSKGNCEYCGAEEVHIQIVRGDTMCDGCLQKEQSVQAATHTITVARAQDDTIKIQQDVWNAATVPFVELKAAILNNPAIPADQKNYVIADEMTARIDKFTATIFNLKQELNKVENERNACMVNLQAHVATLHADKQAKYRQYSINYKSPEPVKPAKAPKAPKTPSINKVALQAAAKKYNVPMAQVQSILRSRAGMSEDAAARELATLMGLI